MSDNRRGAGTFEPLVVTRSFGIVRPPGAAPRAGVLLDDRVLDLAALQGSGALDGTGLPPGVFASPSLNRFLATGPAKWRATRAVIAGLSLDSLPLLALHDLDVLLPVEVGDYADFYASEQHASNMGRMLRPSGPALPAAWRSLPMGYHGRASTVVVSGSPIPRPGGLVAGRSGDPEFQPTACLDVEVELAFVVGVGNERGEPIPVGDAASHVFGAVLLNDWSARDIQRFEAVPLGPFLGKSFATSISPWIVPLDDLAPYALDGPVQDPPPAPYLSCPQPRALDVRLELSINGTVVSRPSTSALYWSMAQQLAHLTVNGASTRPGDLLATGTVSGPSLEDCGSLMELTDNGAHALTLADGSTRTWLQDGDQVTIRGWCGRGPSRIDFGEVTGTIRAQEE